MSMTGGALSSLFPRRGVAPRRGGSRKPLVYLLVLTVLLVLLMHHSSPAAPHAEHLIQLGKQQFENAINSVASTYGEVDWLEPDDQIPQWWMVEDYDEDRLHTANDLVDGSVPPPADDKASWFAGMLSPLKGASTTSAATMVKENYCVDWDPEAPEENDPPRCLRARQYRQVQRVLAREQAGKQYV